MKRTRGLIRILGSLHYLTLEPTAALQGFMDRSSTSHTRPQWRDIWRHSTTWQIVGNASFVLFCYCLSNWRYKITTVKHIIDRRWKQTWTDELRREQSNWKSLFLFVGAKALDDIGFAPMGAVDHSYRCAPRLDTPLVSFCQTWVHTHVDYTV